MAAYAIFDVEIQDMDQYQEFMRAVKSALEAAGGKYLARGAHIRSTRGTGSRGA